MLYCVGVHYISFAFSYAIVCYITVQYIIKYHMALYSFAFTFVLHCTVVCYVVFHYVMLLYIVVCCMKVK